MPCQLQGSKKRKRQFPLRSVLAPAQDISDRKPRSQRSKPTPCDLPEELLFILLGHTEFTTRQRLQRVNKQWRALISLPDLPPSVHLEIDARAHLDSGHLMRAHIPRLCVTAVRKLTFNWRKRTAADFDQHCAELVYRFAARYPNLVSLHLRNLRFNYSARAWSGRYLSVQRTRYGANSLQVVFANSEVTYATADIPIKLSTGMLFWNISLPLVCELQDVVVKAGQSVEAFVHKLVFSHRDEQTAWLVQCAIRVSSDELWIQWLQRMGLIHRLMALADKQINEIFRDGGLAKLAHADLLRLFTGPNLLILAAYLLSRRDLDLPRPPFKFCFETDEFYRTVSSPDYFAVSGV